MPTASRDLRKASRIMDDMPNRDIRELLDNAIRTACLNPDNTWVERFVDYLEREVARRTANGPKKGTAVLTTVQDIERLAVVRDDNRETRMSPLNLFVDAERRGLGLRDIVVTLCALRDAIAREFNGDELISTLQMSISALEAMFSPEADEIEFVPLLRSDSRRIMELTVAISVAHQSGHDHANISPTLLSEALSPRVADFRVALPPALSGVMALATRGVKHGEILSLAGFFRCAHCVYELGLEIVAGKVSTEVVRELAQNTDWLRAKAVPLATVRTILEWRKGRNLPFDFRATVTLVQSMEDVIAFPSGLETLLRYSNNPQILRATADALRTHGLTLAWLVASYRDCGQKIPFEKYVRAVQKFGERAKALVRIDGDNPAVFLEACAQIGVNRACAIARRVRPAQAKTYHTLNALQRAHPLTPLRVLHTYLERGFDTDEIALCARTHELYGVAHQWLADITLGAHTAETLALAYRFERELGRKPAAWESDLLAHEDFLDEARCRGLKRALRNHSEWRERVLEHGNAHHLPTIGNVPARAETAPFEDALINHPRPQDPRDLRFWIAWRIVKRMWAGRQFGAANVSPEDQRARNLPKDLIGLFDEAHAALVKDGVILTRRGMYTRASLNPERLNVIHAILEYRIPENTALSRWVEGGN